MISAEIVTETWQNFAQISESDAPQISLQMTKEQPIVSAYLLALEALPFNLHEHQTIFYIGVVVWQIMKQSDRRLYKVTRKKMDKADAANYESLEYLASDTDADFMSATLSMLENHLEPEVLRYIVEAIMEHEDRDPDDPPIRDEYTELAFIELKTVLDAFVDSLAR